MLFQLFFFFEHDSSALRAVTTAWTDPSAQGHPHCFSCCFTRDSLIPSVPPGEQNRRWSGRMSLQVWMGIGKSLFSFQLQGMRHNPPHCAQHTLRLKELELGYLLSKSGSHFLCSTSTPLSKPCELWLSVCTHLAGTPADNVQQAALHLCSWKSLEFSTIK